MKMTVRFEQRNEDRIKQFLLGLSPRGGDSATATASCATACASVGLTTPSVCATSSASNSSASAGPGSAADGVRVTPRWLDEYAAELFEATAGMELDE